MCIGVHDQHLHRQLLQLRAVPHFVGVRLGRVQACCTSATASSAAAPTTIQVQDTLESKPSVLYDAVAVFGGQSAAATLARVGQSLEFLKDQYRHAKTILALGDCSTLLEKAGIPIHHSLQDPGLIIERDPGNADAAFEKFIAAVGRHRHFDRDVDPPAV
jgi:catalase